MSTSPIIDGPITVTLSVAAQLWLRHGERGVSSDTIFGRLTGLYLVGHWGETHPLDPDDFRRCRLLVEGVPEFRERLGEMAAASPTWAALVGAWDELCALMDEEAPTWRTARGARCPRTYERMRQLGTLG